MHVIFTSVYVTIKFNNLKKLMMVQEEESV